MQVVEVPEGQTAPEGADRIILTPLKDGTFQIDGVVAADPVAIFLAPAPFTSEEEALTTAMSWASMNGAELLFVQRQSLTPGKP